MIAAANILFILLVLKAVHLLLDEMNKVPDKRISKSFALIGKKKDIKDRLSESLIMPFAKVIAVYIKISEEKQIEMQRKLARAEIDMEPEEYIGCAIAKTFLVLPLALMTYLIGSVFLSVITVVIAVMVGYQSFASVNSRLLKKREKIEQCLPGFVRAILHKLNESGDGVVKADLVSIFEDYLKVASDVFKYDVSILIMEMKSKDTETALREFNSRLGIVEVSFLCNALIGLTRGEPQNVTLASLAKDMDIKARENIRRALQKKPGQVRLLCIPLAIVTMVTVAYVIASHLMMSMAMF